MAELVTCKNKRTGHVVSCAKSDAAYWESRGYKVEGGPPKPAPDNPVTETEKPPPHKKSRE